MEQHGLKFPLTANTHRCSVSCGEEPKRISFSGNQEEWKNICWAVDSQSTTAATTTMAKILIHRQDTTMAT